MRVTRDTGINGTVLLDLFEMLAVLIVILVFVITIVSHNMILLKLVLYEE